MSTETDRKPVGRWARRVAIVAATAAVVAPATVWAANIPDVPDGNVHHNNINWAFENGVTSGCGGGNYCPEDSVTRAQMATFMRNLASYVSSAGVHVSQTAGGPSVTSFYNNVNDEEPTVSVAGGIVVVDLGFDVTGKIVQCTPERAGANLSTDNTCTAAIDGETVRIINLDTNPGVRVEGDFFLTVSG